MEIQLHSDTTLYAEIYELTGEAEGFVIQMRKSAKPIWGERIIAACVNMDLSLMAANMAPAPVEKELHFVQLLRHAQVVEFASRICRDRKHFALTHYSRLVERVEEIGLQTNRLRSYWKRQDGTQQGQLFGSQGSRDRA
jgi:hypothetical protein